VLSGVRMALPAKGPGGGVIRSAVLALTAGVALLVGALTFSASMGHLVATPRLRGWTWDVQAGNYSQLSSAAAAGRFLAGDHDVAEYTATNSAVATGPGGQVNLVGLGRVGMARLPIFSGRLPARAGEIAVTTRTLARFHRKVGDRVTLRINTASSFRIVGTSLGPGVASPDMQLGEGGIVVLSDLAKLVPGGPNPEGYLVRFRAGVDRSAALARLRPEFRGAVLGPWATTEVETIRRTEPLPRFFAALVAVFALGALIHAVNSALRRNRREVALLKAIGFGRGQVRVTILAQAALLVGVAALVGLPVGIAAGRLAWRLAAKSIGVVAEPVLPVLTLVAVVGASMLLAVLVGAVTARAAERVPVAATLHAE